MFDYLREQGHPWNHKRVHRIYTMMKLKHRRRHKKRLPARIKEPLTLPIYPNAVWSMDFMADSLVSGRRFRILNIMDDYNREVLTLTIDMSIRSERVVRTLNELIEWRGKPEVIRVDNGPEFIARPLAQWCEEHDVHLQFIQPGKPTQNALIERLNRTYREEVLDQYLFESLRQVRALSQEWIWMYNHERPHESLERKSPRKFLEARFKPELYPSFIASNYQPKSLTFNCPN